MSRTVHVELGERSYGIEIGRDLPICPALRDRAGADILIVSDSNVDPLYGDRTELALRKAGANVTRAVVPAGEQSKCQERLGRLYEKAVGAGLDRAGVIVALGGGVVGDLAGFLAASYLRGIALVQMPTSVLAMVDSSVGGKTGINLPQGKNLVGAFHQPCAVHADLTTLETLPQREYLSGLAEIVKTAVIRDASLFALLEEKRGQLVGRDAELLEQVIARCCEIKAAVVAEDEREGGLRAILNFGHTLAHALEREFGYGRLLHGEAVALGMVYACELSVAQTGLAPAEAARVKDLLAALGLPVGRQTLPDLQAAARALDWTDLRRAIGTDKKVRGRVPYWVLARGIGQVEFGCEVEEPALEAAWGNVAGA